VEARERHGVGGRGGHRLHDQLARLEIGHAGHDGGRERAQRDRPQDQGHSGQHGRASSLLAHAGPQRHDRQLRLARGHRPRGRVQAHGGLRAGLHYVLARLGDAAAGRAADHDDHLGRRGLGGRRRGGGGGRGERRGGQGGERHQETHGGRAQGQVAQERRRACQRQRQGGRDRGEAQQAKEKLKLFSLLVTLTTTISHH